MRLYMYHLYVDNCVTHQFNVGMIQRPPYTRMHATRVVRNANQPYVRRHSVDGYVYSPHVIHAYVCTAQYRGTHTTTTH